jgi:hypothetical protein
MKVGNWLELLSRVILFLTHVMKVCHVGAMCHVNFFLTSLMKAGNGLELWAPGHPLLDACDGGMSRWSYVSRQPPLDVGDECG